jgi:hypothetical protein
MRAFHFNSFCHASSIHSLKGVHITPADVHDTRGARCPLAGLAPLVPRLKKIWADGAYRGQELADWRKAEGDWDLEVVERDPGVRGFSSLRAAFPLRFLVACVALGLVAHVHCT